MSMVLAKPLAVLLSGMALCGCFGCAGRRAAPRVPASRAPAAEFRAFWVDEFHTGIRMPEEAEQLVASARRAHLNALIVQVRGRGDALYKKSFEPPREDPAYDPNFDALEYIIDAAHRAGLEVHAWVNATPSWRDPVPPRDPRHVFNQHGPGQSGDSGWFTRSPQGETRFPVGYFLDPGHPAAAAYLADVYLNIVRNYDVDGIHFDYIRYPETSETLPRGSPVGYNAVSLERFRRTTRRTDTPAPDDPQWMAWRRQQVTQLVRRVYLEAKLLRPKVKVSAAVVAWGAPPTSGRQFADTAPVQRVFQDWHGWLEEGLLDLTIPMNYARESDPVVRGWFDGWLHWEKRHKHGRQLAIGIGAYLNSPEATLAQVHRARQPEGKQHADGVSFFSYANLQARPAPADSAGGSAPPPTTEANLVERVAFLASGTATQHAVFSAPAPLPRMDWLDQPRRGALAGVVRSNAGIGMDGAIVSVKRTGWFRRSRRVEADGNGFFGLTQLKPGRYRVRLEGQHTRRIETWAEIQAEVVTRVELSQP